MDFDTYERMAVFEYAEFAEMASKILSGAIASDSNLRLQQIQARAKTPKSLKKKLIDRKISGTLNLEAEIKDLAGCRTIFYTNSDVTRFVNSGLIQNNFEVLEAKLHYPKNDKNNDESLYISQHFVLKFSPERLALIEYARFRNMRFELQIQTILNHAWSEMEHDIVYKKPALDGFGGALFNSINMRMKKIMRTYLLPAGYEFQKVADDFDRLISGKKLFDEDVLEAVVIGENNNERVDNLARLAYCGQINDLFKFADIGAHEVVTMRRVGMYRPLKGHALYVLQIGCHEFIGTLAYPVGGGRICGATIDCIVFKAAVVWRIVGRSNDDAIGQAGALIQAATVTSIAAPVIHQDSQRYSRCRRIFVTA